MLGRDFTAEDDRPGAYNWALISYALWRSRFGANPSVSGKALSIDGSAVHVVGVLPRDFEFPTLDRIELLVPQRLRITTYMPNQSGRALHVIGRLKNGTFVQQAFAELEPFFRFQLQGVPPRFRKEVAPSVIAMRDSQLGGLTKAGLLLAGAITAIFFIQIANIASLMLARGVGRTREFDIRFSLGARRGRLMCQVVTETVIIALIGGAAGSVIAAGSMRLLRSLFLQPSPTAVRSRSIYEYCSFVERPLLRRESLSV